MQRAISIALSIAAVVLSAVLAFKSAPDLPRAAAAPPSSASPPDAGVTRADVSAIVEAGALEGADAGQSAESADIPALGSGAPRHVRFGVVLVTYEGAEGAPEKGARRKPDALSLATKLADEAHATPGDFHAVVQRGDTGSTDDVGTVARGVLEPSSEAALFALPVGGVSGVIDTPRGFWIVKRLE